MQPGTIPANEAARLATLRHDDILDTSAESEFDDFARLAAQICGAPMSIISRVDEGRQWFMSNIGVDACVTPGFIAFAGHVIHGKDIFEVP
ncbi:MAG: hypothetical protein ABI728_04620, partial [Betaproteobacteria bacterium]